MNVSAKDIPRQQQFFTEYWNLYKKYFGMWLLTEKERDQVCEQLIADQKIIYDKYKDEDFSLFVRDLVVDMTLEFERKLGTCSDGLNRADLPPKRN